MIAALPLALLLAQATQFPALSAARTVHASGEGRVSAAPDVARVVIGVQAQEPTVARANADATTRMKKVLAALEKAGVAAKDIRTLRYNVDVQRSFQGPNAGAVIGYIVVNQAQVTVRELPRLGAVLEQAVSAGANEVGGISLEKEDTSADRARALERAMSDARGKASVLAKAAGGSLGEAVQISESGRGPIVPMGPMMRTAAAASEVPVSSGELEIVAAVDVTFALR